MAQSEPVHGVDLTDRLQFPYWTQISLRFADMDRLGHVNNVAIISFCESARVELREAVWQPMATDGGHGVAVVRSTILYLAQAFFPGTIFVGTRVLKLGRSSYTLGQACFSAERCVATMETVNVWADLKAERSAPLPETLRAALAHYAGAVPAKAT